MFSQPSLYNLKVSKLFLLLVTLVGLLTFLFISLTSGFKNNLFSYLFPISESKAATTNKFVPNQIIIKYKTEATNNDRDLVLTEHNAKFKASGYENKNEVLLEVPDGKVLEIVEKLKNNTKIEVVEPNYIAHERLLPNDPDFLATSPNKQWGLKHVKTPEAWDATQGSQELRIAILDTGIKEDHPDIQGKVVDRISYASCDSTTDDWGGVAGIGHGTMVAGIAAANTNNGLGIAGMGYNTKLLNVKVSGNGCPANFWTIKEGILWAKDHGAKVINMSVGGMIADPLMTDAINQAWNAGIILVGAVANIDTTDSYNDHPASYEQVIAVTGTDSQDKKIAPAAYGDWVEVAAPGKNMYGPCILQSIYCDNSGSSFAAPMVSGLAALLFAQHPEWTNQQVRDQIQNTADKIPGTQGAPETSTVLWKHGRINACRAVGGLNCQTSFAESIIWDNTSTALIFAPENQTWSHTIGTGSNRLLLVGVSANVSGAASVTYAGQPLTRIGFSSNPNTRQLSEIWYLINPPSGTHDIFAHVPVARNDGSGSAATVGATSWFGVNQTTPLGTYVSIAAAASSTSLSVPSESGDLVIDVITRLVALHRAMGTGVDQTKRWELDLSTINGAGSTKPASPTSTTMTWIFPGTNNYSISGIAIKPALSIFPDPSPTPSPSTSPTPTPTPTPTPSPTPTPADTTNPQIVITSPAINANLAKRSSVTIAANASDNIAVARVEFYIGSSFIGSDLSAPYSTIWVTPNQKKQYIITARAYDTSNNSSFADINVNVN